MIKAYSLAVLLLLGVFHHQSTLAQEQQVSQDAPSAPTQYWQHDESLKQWQPIMIENNSNQQMPHPSASSSSSSSSEQHQPQQGSQEASGSSLGTLIGSISNQQYKPSSPSSAEKPSSYNQPQSLIQLPYPAPAPAPHPHPAPSYPAQHPHPAPSYPAPHPHPEPSYPAPHPHPEPSYPAPHPHPHPHPAPAYPVPVVPLAPYAIQQPGISSYGEPIIENLIGGIPFDCRGQPTGPVRDNRFCDIFHACVFGQQRKTYACPYVGERTYFEPATQRCEFVRKNPHGCSLNAYYH